MKTESSLRFVPSRFDGLPDVTEVVIRTDRMELLSADTWMIYHYSDFARLDGSAWFRRLAIRLGLSRFRGFVADRDWFHPPRDRFFRFFTSPQITVYMTDEPPGVEYGDTLFYRIQCVIRAGGYETNDLG